MSRPVAAAEPISSTSIAEAALALLEEDGTEALSFRRVATALGTSHMTIHRHCGSFDALLDMCAEHLAATLPEVSPALDWADATERRFTALYELWTANSSLLLLMRGRPWWGQHMLARFAEPALRSNLDAGMTPSEMIQTFRQMYLFTLGCSMTHAGYSSHRALPVIAALDPTAFPVLTTHMHVIADSVAEREIFRTGLLNLISCAPNR